LFVPGDAPPPERDMALIKLLADAFDARELVAAHPGEPIHRIAAAHARCRKRLGNLHRLSYLAPDIVTAILDGVQPPTLTPAALLAAELPLGWADQKVALGFA
jgi:hypothetical protein